MVHRSVIDRIGFFQPLGSRAKDDLAARAVTRRFPAGGRLWDAGSPARGLFIILSGRVRIVRSRGTRQHVVHTEGPNATIGEVPLFAGGTYPASAIASEPVECLVIDRASLIAAVKAHPELAFVLLERMANRVRHLLDRLSAQTADPVAARLAVFLAGRPEGTDGCIALGGTQAQVAEEVGTVREVVVRLLRTFAADGIIEARGRARYAVLNRARLRKLADADESGY